MIGGEHEARRSGRRLSHAEGRWDASADHLPHFILYLHFLIRLDIIE